MWSCTAGSTLAAAILTVFFVTLGLKSGQAVPVLIPDVELYDRFYNGCCNATFWPLFHSMPDRTVFDINTWQVEAFKGTGTRDLIWLKVVSLDRSWLVGLTDC